jgi:hypothetical protein
LELLHPSEANSIKTEREIASWRARKDSFMMYPLREWI